MPTSEDLVPNDQPQGSRQETVAGMQQAGLPLSTSPSSGQPELPAATPASAPSQPQIGPQGPPMSGLDLLAGRSPADFPFIGGEESGSPAASEPDSVMSALAASAQSSFAQAVLSRLQSRR